MEEYDCRFKFPFTWFVSGGTGCGKTTMVLKFLRHHKILTTNPECSNVIYCYNEWQSGFDSLAKEDVVTEWYEGLPTMETIKEKIEPFKSTGTILVLDDFGQQLNSSYVELFTVVSHHSNCSVILMTQNLFDKNPIYRPISMNSKYMTVFKNPRDNHQISALARQTFPESYRDIVKIFHKATEKPHSYLFFDFDQKTPNKLRVRTQILPQEGPMKCFIPRI